MGTPKGFVGVVFESLIGIPIFGFARTLSFFEKALFFTALPPDLLSYPWQVIFGGSHGSSRNVFINDIINKILEFDIIGVGRFLMLFIHVGVGTPCTFICFTCRCLAMWFLRFVVPRPFQRKKGGLWNALRLVLSWYILHRLPYGLLRGRWVRNIKAWWVWGCWNDAQDPP